MKKNRLLSALAALALSASLLTACGNSDSSLSEETVTTTTTTVTCATASEPTAPETTVTAEPSETETETETKTETETEAETSTTTVSSTSASSTSFSKTAASTTTVTAGTTVTTSKKSAATTTKKSTSGTTTKATTTTTQKITYPGTASSSELDRPGKIRGLTPAQLIAEMTVGWNLGNSLDATSASGLKAETSWGNPKTTKAMIDAVKARGFNTIRIPVTWGGHLGKAPDYTVDKAWMDRVQEVVNYAIDDGMYVILDSHHEESWRIPDNAHIDAVNDEVYRLWVQIAERFINYGDHLVLEGLNEPRVSGGTNEWNGGTAEGRRCIDRLNQTFIDAVRSTGGNNSTRLLLVTTFASSSVSQAINDVAVPKDKNIAFSIHSYTPYQFTYNSNQIWELFSWDGSHDYEITNMFNDLKKAFLDKGVPVIITEFGAVNKNGNDADVARWVTVYLQTAKKLGIPCVWWDNGYYSSGNELFGIFDRNGIKWFTDTVVDAIMKVYAQ